MIIAVGGTAARTRMPFGAGSDCASIFPAVSEQIEFRVCPYREKVVVKYTTQIEFFKVLKEVAGICRTVRHHRELAYAAGAAHSLRQRFLFEAGRIDLENSDVLIAALYLCIKAPEGGICQCVI